jgi:biopolymer transport protein ExbB/TolQ
VNPCPGAYGALFRWLVFVGLVLLGVVVAADNGLITQLLASDESRLSAVILAVLLVASLDAGRRAWRLGRELCAAQRLNLAAMARRPILRIDDADGVALVGDEATSIAHRHLLLLAGKVRQHGSLCDQTLLLEHLENSLGRGHETGWFIADLMVRLGLLGTVIGFIFMLGSVAQVSSVDLPALQQLLTSMSAGMRVALYTTLTGLGAGILLGFQYRLLDSAVDRLMAEIIELSEVHITPQLRELVVANGHV